MGKIFNFDKKRIQKLVRENFDSSDLRYEILLSTVRYIYSYIKAEYQYPTQHIKITDKTSDHFDGDEDNFVLALVELFDYWNLSHLEEFKMKDGAVFKRFPEVNDIAVYIFYHLETSQE